MLRFVTKLICWQMELVKRLEQTSGKHANGISLTFSLLECRYPLCGSDGGDAPLHELCGLLPDENRLLGEEED